MELSIQPVSEGSSNNPQRCSGGTELPDCSESEFSSSDEYIAAQIGKRLFSTTTEKKKARSPKNTNAKKVNTPKDEKKGEDNASYFSKSKVSDWQEVLKGNFKLKKIKIPDYGIVIKVDDCIATVRGFNKKLRIGSIISFDKSKCYGTVITLEHNNICKVASHSIKVSTGESVHLHNSFSTIKCTRAKKGHILDAMGRIVDTHLHQEQPVKRLLREDSILSKLPKYANFLYNKLVYYTDVERSMEYPAPAIMDRIKICDPLYTGITIIDMVVPIGKGQRQLIIGDRQTGKTSVAVDMILTQSNMLRQAGYFGINEVTSIYVSIGQRRSEVNSIFRTLKFFNAAQSAIIIAATAAEACSLQYFAAYAGCAFGEFFRDSGMDSVVIYDDLTKHAVAYRQMCLMLRRAPGRDAYPCDIFYAHSRLLERAAATRCGSITALPVIETQANDLTAFIPTNVISITDGQVFLEAALFSKGTKPAVNILLSVSRIGASAQCKLFKKIGPLLKRQLGMYRIFDIFESFSDDISIWLKRTLRRGGRLTQIIKQHALCPVPFFLQGLMVYSCARGYLDCLMAKEMGIYKNLVLFDVERGRVKHAFHKQMLSGKHYNNGNKFDLTRYLGITVATVRFLWKNRSKRFAAIRKKKRLKRLGLL